MSIGVLDTILQIAFLYAIVGISVTFSFRVIGFPDLTPDGSFVLGAAISSVMLLHGSGTGVSVAAAALAGAAAGVATCLLSTRMRLPPLLCGILMALALYSLSLRIMGTSNLALLGQRGAFSGLLSRVGSPIPVITCASLCGLVFLGCFALLRTQMGLLLRAAGDSPSALELSGYRREPILAIGLGLSNAIAASAGAIISQYQGFADITMGTGLVVIALATLVIGEALIRPSAVPALLAAPILGTILYQAIVAVALQVGLLASDLKITAAALTIGVVSLERLRDRRSGPSRQIGNRLF